MYDHEFDDPDEVDVYFAQLNARFEYNQQRIKDALLRIAWLNERLEAEEDRIDELKHKLEEW